MPRRASASMPGRIAAAMMNARKRSARTSFSFQSARTPTTIAITTSVAIAARLAVSPITRDFSPRSEGDKPMAARTEEVRLDERRHAIVLVRPFLRALVLTTGGVSTFVLGWPLTVAGGVLLALAASIAVRAVWRWERTHVVLTSEK